MEAEVIPQKLLFLPKDGMMNIECLTEKILKADILPCWRMSFFANISGSVLQHVVTADSALLKTQGAYTYFAVKVR
ncbi:hypothetical protein LC048_21850 [Mesobacillus subterraneus]|uniref:hypothetical protein n=1 Tax=Mesobacillus subterraneus TaxID=285983 RepID=UPI001CFCD703|nr:hypothetical protein [Mesobacillus subterraneus]WLR54967.1 hypothetical protein LC048_21850 [Mesobacillus subterraneus]